MRAFVHEDKKKRENIFQHMFIGEVSNQGVLGISVFPTQAEQAEILQPNPQSC